MSQDSLFDLDPADERAVRVKAAKWGGNDSRKARALCRAMLPHACRKCGIEIQPTDPESSWHAGHREGDERHQGGGHDGIEPEHARCNTSAGGRVGAAITNSRRQPVQTKDIARERVPQWW